jgi:predicted ester cyclase
MEHNKRLVRMFVEEIWNERKLELADTIFDENCHAHQLQSGPSVVAIPRGPAAIRTHVADWLSAFPDLRFNIEQMFSEEDRVFSLRCPTFNTNLRLQRPDTSTIRID